MGVRMRGRLLLVEDEDVLRGLIAQFLRGEGYDIVEAPDGLQGVGLFASHGPFDLVLLDLNLPLMPGVEVCRRIKSRHPSQSVMICSAAILDSHLSVLHGLDVDQFLTKPYHPLELLERIGISLARNQQTQQDLSRRSESPADWRSDPPRRPNGPRKVGEAERSKGFRATTEVA